MILLSSPLTIDPTETTVRKFFLEIEIVTTKIVNSKSLKKICRQVLSTMNVLKKVFQIIRAFFLNGVDVLKPCKMWYVMSNS